MRKAILAIVTILAVVGCATKQPKATSDYSISYKLSFEPKEHYIDVNMRYEGSTSDSAVLFKMPVWAPGYYLIVDFPKYLTDFSATDGNGNPLKWEKVGKNGWSIEASDVINASYRIFADFRSVAECRVEENMAFVAPNGVYMYKDVDHPVSVSLELPENWTKVSTALPYSDGVYTASNFDVLFDSPMLIGNHWSKTVEHNGHLYEFALETPKGFEEGPYIKDFLSAVDEAIAIFGDTHFEDYHLLLLGEGRGGLEHFASQACYTAGEWNYNDRKAYLGMMNFITHEFFHSYNVKAIRPIELGPFDYDKEVFTPMLWVSEGFTVYYEGVLLNRAGVTTDQEFLDFISEYIKDVESKEGHKHMSLRQSSYDIWLNFFNTAANGDDVRISYYIKGPVMGLLMDAEIQGVSGGKASLDDLMNLLYHRYFKEQGRGFTEEEFWAAAEEVAGGSMARMRRYVDTTDEIDYESVLEPLGLTIDRNTWKLVRKAPVEEQLKDAA